MQGSILEMEKEEQEDCLSNLHNKKEFSMMQGSSKRKVLHANQGLSNNQIQEEESNPNIQCSKSQFKLFCQFVRVKQQDRPKDTAACVQLKRNKFLQYIDPSHITNSLSQPKQKVQDISEINVSIKKFYEYPITKKVEPNSILIIRLVPSETGTKNNNCLIVTNMKGEVVYFLPDILATKRINKITTVVSDYKLCYFVVFDQCFTEWNSTDNYFTPIFNDPSRPIFYHIINAPKHQVTKIEPYLFQNKSDNKLNFEHKQNVLTVFPAQFDPQKTQQLLSTQLNQQINTIFESQAKFLIQLRGQKSIQDRNIIHDLLAVNLWRSKDCSAGVIANKIIRLYQMKEESYLQPILQKTSNSEAIHTPIKIQKQQNCVLCSTLGLRNKPKRTYSICQVCSHLKQKPIYLCKTCFKEYHQNPDHPLFKKNEKKTKKAVRAKQEQKKNAIKEELIQKMNIEVDEDDWRSRDQKEAIFGQLDKMTDQYIQNVNSLIRQGDKDTLKACEYYLEMLQNRNIQFMEMIAQSMTNPEYTSKESSQL